MRLPWPSRRSIGRSTGGGAAALAAAGDGAQSPNAHPVGRSEWRHIGTLRPSFRADPGVRVQRFRADLAGSRLPDPILRPLGHERSADGPAGLVSGLTRPVISRVVAGLEGSGSLPMIIRRAAPAADTPAVVDDGVAVGVALPEMEPRRVPAVTGSTTVNRSLTTAQSIVGTWAAAPAAAAPGVVQRDRAPLVAQTPPLNLASAASVARDPGSSATMASPGVRTILRSATGSRVRLGPPISRSADAPLTLVSPMDAPSRAGATASRMGAGAASSGSGSAGDAPLAGGLLSAIPGMASESGPTVAMGSAGAPNGSGAGSSRLPYGSLAPVGLVRARVVTAPDPTVIGAPDVLTSSPAVPPTTTAPLVGSEPLSPTTWPPGSASGPAGASAQTFEATRRAGSAPASTSSGAAARPSAAVNPRAIQRDSAPMPASNEHSGAAGGTGPATDGRSNVVAAPRPNSGSGLSARGATVDGHVTIPAEIGPLDRGSGRAVLAHELVHVQQQRTLGAQMPAPGSESAHRLESVARTAEAAASWEELTLAKPATRPAPADAPPSAGMTVSRTTGGPPQGRATTAVHVAMQLADGDAPPPAADTTEVAGTPAAAGGGASGATGVGATLSERDLDEVLRRLYPRLRRSLSSELLVARERAGMLADQH